MPAVLYFSSGRVHLSSTAARLSTLYYPAQIMASSEKKRGFISSCATCRFFIFLLASCFLVTLFEWFNLSFPTRSTSTYRTAPSVVIGHRFDAGPDPTFNFDGDPDPDPDPKFLLMLENRRRKFDPFSYQGTALRIRIGRPWMPIPVRIRQNDAAMTGSGTGSTRLTVPSCQNSKKANVFTCSFRTFERKKI